MVVRVNEQKREVYLATVLFAYEFGEGLGHLNLLVPIAKRLARHHRVVFAVPDLMLAAPVLTSGFGEDVCLHQGPQWSAVLERVQALGTACDTLAETLNLFGFDDPDLLRRAVNTWFQVYRQERPDLIVADSAPTARLAFETHVPMIVVGTGYTVLPSGRVAPPLRPWQSLVSPRARATEARILTRVNEIREKSNGLSVDYFTDLFQGDDTFASTLPGFDPYREFRKFPTSLPYAFPDVTVGPPLEHRTGPSIFVYLPHVHPSLKPTLDVLNSMTTRSHVFVSGGDPNKVAAYCRPHIAIHARPANFTELLPQCRLLVHHAGLGTCFAGMAAGVPQLTLPVALENTINGLGLNETGSALCIQATPGPDVDSLRAAIARLQTERSFETSAAEAAGLMATIRSQNPLDRVIAAAYRHLNHNDAKPDP